MKTTTILYFGEFMHDPLKVFDSGLFFFLKLICPTLSIIALSVLKLCDVSEAGSASVISCTRQRELRNTGYNSLIINYLYSLLPLTIFDANRCLCSDSRFHLSISHLRYLTVAEYTV
jgi:hypothetical protein